MTPLDFIPLRGGFVDCRGAAIVTPAASALGTSTLVAALVLFARTTFRTNLSFSCWAAFLSPCARVFSPIVDKRHIYRVDGMEEIAVDFVESNHQHRMFRDADIHIGP